MLNKTGIMRHTKRAVATLLATAMLLSSVSCGQKSKYSLERITLADTENSWSCPEEKYATLLAKYDKNRAQGAYVVATDADVVYMYCEDATEKDGVTPVSQDTIFDIASASKTFTAVAILQLAEKGKLSIDDTIDKYFPEYENGKKIRIYDLLHMTTGSPDYLNNPDPFWNISGADAANQKLSDIFQDRTTDAEFMQALYQAPLSFEPGSEYEYSNTNYRLLAFIIEQITGMKYCDYVKKNIFDKCGMKKTTSMAVGDLTYVPADYEDLVTYGFSDENGYPVCPNNCRGDGGIHSCLTDMLAFDRALFGGKLLNEKSMEVLLTDVNGYCCGLKRETNGYAHDGSSLSCAANNKIIESEEYGHIYVISLVHASGADASEGYDFMNGTNYTKCVVEDGVYTNEYANLKIIVPEGFYMMGAESTEMSRNNSISELTEEMDIAIETATVWDAVLMGYEDVIQIDFINTRLAVPNDMNFTADEYLDHFEDYELRMVPKSMAPEVGSERVKVNFGGREYLRTQITLHDYSETGNIYNYVCKLDENLMCSIQVAIWSKKTPEEYEKLISALED